MRIIPGNTKVKIELFKGIDVWDLLVGAIGAIMLACLLVSTIPFKMVFSCVHVFLCVGLIARLDSEATYKLVMHIIRHYGVGRYFDRNESDEMLYDAGKRGLEAVAFDQIFAGKEKAAQPEVEEKAQVETEEEHFDEEIVEEELNEVTVEDAVISEAPSDTAVIDDVEITEIPDASETPEAEEGEQVETKAERKKRLKAEKAEYKADTKKLKSKKLSKEEEDAIWIKRAKQAEANKKKKQSAKKESSKAKKKWAEMENLSAFSGIKDGFIEYGNGKYYGAVLEIPSVELKFFSNFRRNNSIENALGALLRSAKSDLATNIVKIERPVSYDHYIQNEAKKLEDLRASYEEGFIKEEELKSRVAIVYDRIYSLQNYKEDNKVVIAFYYIVLFDSDKKQLRNTVAAAIEQLRIGEMNAKYIKDSKDIAIFLKYTNALDFEEVDAKRVRPEDLAKWAMPDKVEFTPRMTIVNDIATHNFRVVNYPTSVYDAWLASLMTYPSTKVIVKLTPMDSGKAIKSIDKSLAELRSKLYTAGTDSAVLEAQTHIETLQLLLTTLQSESESLLDVNIYVSAYDVLATLENPKLDDPGYDSYRYRVSGMKKVIKRIWKESGFKLNTNEFNQALAYVGSQVSGYDPFAVDGRGMPSNTVAAMFPWVFPHVMDEDGVQLGSSDGVPVFVDFFRRDSERVNSNMVVIGKSGSGKSYSTKSLLCNLAADDSKIFILDPENEYADLAKNLHGKFINVANAKYGRLNPFHIITTLDDEDSQGGDAATSSYATHLQFLEEFFKQILPDCDKDSLEYLNSLVDRVYASKGINPHTDLSRLKPTDYPIFDDLYDEILREFQRTDNEYIKTMLRTLMNYVSKFSEGGRNSVIWNGPSTVTTEENFTVFNFQSLLSNRNSTIANAQMLLVLKYVDNEIIKNREYNTKYGLNRKVVVVIDEAHVFIDPKYPIALDFMFQLAKRIRKYNGMQIVITQNIKDFVGSEEIARKSTAIINACQYSFIFALAPNDMDDLCKLYEKAGGINESEQEQIVQAQRGHAFTVMSPTSRTSFKVTVPDDVRDLFSDPNYRNPYFTGNGGEENWNAFLKDSKDKRWINLESRGVDVKALDSDEEASKSFVKFDEISLEEFTPELLAPKEDELLIERISPSSVGASQELDIEKLTGSGSVSLEEIDSIAGLGSDNDEFADLKKQLAPQTMLAAQGLTAAVAQQAQSASKTEEILAGLVDKLTTDNMMDEIKKAVREEIDKEMSSRGVPVASTATAESAPAASESSLADFGLFDSESTENEEKPASGEPSIFDALLGSSDESDDDFTFDFSIDGDDTDETEDSEAEGGEGGAVLGSIFDFAEMADIDAYEEPEEHYDMEGEEEEETTDDHFDIMSFLSQQADDAEVEETHAVIDDFINGSETVLDVSLEQLVAYNRAKKKEK